MLNLPFTLLAGAALSVGLVGNIADVLPELARRGVVPDVLTDQTSAHDLRVGYIPVGLGLDGAARMRETDPTGYESRVHDMTLNTPAQVTAPGAVADRSPSIEGCQRPVADSRVTRRSWCPVPP